MKHQPVFFTFSKNILAFGICIVYMLASCASNEVGNSKDVNPDAIYFDYHISGDEESGYITVKAQYRFGGPNGTTLVLNEPANVKLDGEPLQADSSKMNGAWYELLIPAKEFSGHHSIVFTDHNNKEYKEEFDFTVISLKKEIPPVLSRDTLVFELERVQPGDRIKLLLTDTAYYSRGIDRVDTVQNGRIMISKQDLDNVKNGPVAIEFYKEEERELKETTAEGGKINISYGLKRVFELKD